MDSVAELKITLEVACPNCGLLFDIMSETDSKHNDLLLYVRGWMNDGNKELDKLEVQCPNRNCKRAFIVVDIEL